IQSRGYEAAYLWFGLAQGVVVMAVALLLRAPQPAEVVAAGAGPRGRGPREYPAPGPPHGAPFFPMYARFVLVGGAGLVCTRATRSRGQGLRDRQRASIDARAHHAGTELCVVRRARAQRLVAAALRLAVRSDRT